MDVAYVLIRADHGKLKIVSAALKQFDEVDEVHEVYGRFDVVAKVICNDRSELKSFMQNKLQILEGVASSETLLVNDLYLDEE